MMLAWISLGFPPSLRAIRSLERPYVSCLLHNKQRRLMRFQFAEPFQAYFHGLTMASMALHVCYHNLCRVHTTLCTTPAMAMGVTDHIWSVEELVVAALAKETTPESPKGKPSPEFTPDPVTSTAPVRFTVLRVGKDVE